MHLQQECYKNKALFHYDIKIHWQKQVKVQLNNFKMYTYIAIKRKVKT